MVWHSIRTEMSILGMAALLGVITLPWADALAIRVPSASLSPATVAVSGFVARPRSPSLIAVGFERRSFCDAQHRRRHLRHRSHGGGGGGYGTSMLFDFIKKRAKEGVEQTQNLVSAVQEGRLDEALKKTSAYVKDRYNYNINTNISIVL